MFVCFLFRCYAVVVVLFFGLFFVFFVFFLFCLLFFERRGGGERAGRSCRGWEKVQRVIFEVFWSNTIIC